MDSMMRAKFPSKSRAHWAKLQVARRTGFMISPPLVQVRETKFWSALLLTELKVEINIQHPAMIHDDTLHKYKDELGNMLADVDVSFR
jgi:hypothetical protein